MVAKIFSIAAFALAAASHVAMAATSLVKLDGSVVFQTMAGFGASERVFDDPHLTNTSDPATGRGGVVIPTAAQDEILDRLYVDLKLTRVRPATEAGIEPVNDNADPLATDLSRFNFDWKRNDAHVEHVRRARARGVTTWFLSPIVLESWMTADTPKEEYVEWAMAVIRRWRDLGVALPFYSLINEPGYPRSGIRSGEWLRDVIKLLGARLRAEGLGTMIVTPDDVRSSDSAARAKVILADPQARQYVGALATHLYDEPLSNVAQMRSLSEQYGIPLWMTEASQSFLPTMGLANDPFDWARVIHELIAVHNVAAVDYLWGFFGQWDVANQLLIVNYDKTTYTGYTLTKAYFVTGQYSRFVPPGAQRVAAASQDADVRVSAFRVGGKPVVVAFNPTSTSRTLLFSVSGFDRVRELNATRTSDAENWAVLAPISVDRGSFTVTLPPRSVTTYAAGESPSGTNPGRPRRGATASP